MILLVGLAAANPLDAWGPHVDQDVLAINPNAYRDTEGNTELQGVVGLGLTQRADVQLSAAATVAAGTTAMGPVEVLPRWFLADGVGLAAHGTWEPGGASLGPELHLTLPLSPGFDLYADGGGAWGWSDGGDSSGEAFVVAGTEWVAPARIRPYLQASAEFAPGQPTPIHLTPGAYVVLDDEGNSELCTGLRLPLRGGPVVAGIWFNQNIHLRRRSVGPSTAQMTSLQAQGDTPPQDSNDKTNGIEPIR